MDIVRSLELESFTLTKLTKPSVPVNNMVGPSKQGVFIFLGVIRRHFLACEDIAGGSDLSTDGNVFFAECRGPSNGSQLSGGGIIILHVIRRHFLACGRAPSCQPLHA